MSLGCLSNTSQSNIKESTFSSFSKAIDTCSARKSNKEEYVFANLTEQDLKYTFQVGFVGSRWVLPNPAIFGPKNQRQKIHGCILNKIMYRSIRSSSEVETWFNPGSVRRFFMIFV